MKLIYRGKTKDVYILEDGNYLLKFKDDVTGENGVFDPGANTIGLTIAGAGKAALRLTRFFFEILKQKDIPTHYIEANLKQNTMVVKSAAVFGKGLEVICRYRAVGSFFRRYGEYIKEGSPLDALVEFTLKDDARNDPLITEDTLQILGILSKEEYRILKELSRKIGKIIKEELASKGIELYDIKLEFGRAKDNMQLILIDEISGGNMRAFKDGKYLEPLELEELLTNS
ncbi:MAG: phosphoribosylaminoimidazolesuccinocarboxamide synthase [Atribacterota bacterium]|nr:phosphoribosylaminoimidazolesuccinocarboxamide synthase [Atribacterota bacterium]MDD4895466.1 phosphoribosylaminoimidazolesuccinocarboxamide synthase [Atribacterota bacterium]MDD5637899.1 phosphoribosylaminoimidazolesuccinocarboxamide synthase [Atribacterota bacterium]